MPEGVSLMAEFTPFVSPVVVVGVDGSPGSVDAVRWAARHARLIGGEVRAVLAWEIPVTIFAVPGNVEEDYGRDAGARLEKVLAEALGDDAGVPLTTRMVQNNVARALMHEAERAELLVIGSGGHGGLPGVHLGSVASYCVHHAPCPVVVVRRSSGG